MGDHQHGAARHGLIQAPLHRLLRFGIQGAGGLIQQQHRRIAEHRPGDGQPLQLAAGEVAAPLLHPRLVALRQGFDEAIGVGQPRRRLDLLEAGGAAEGDGVGHRAGEHGALLRHQRHRLAQFAGPQVRQVAAIQQHPAALGGVEAQQQRKQGALACAGGAHQGHHLPRFHLQAEVAQHRLARLIAEAHLLEGQLTGHRPEGLGVGPIRRLHRLALDLPQPLERGLPLLEFVEVGGEVADRIDQHQQGRHIAAESLAVEVAALDAGGPHQQHRQDAGGLQEAHHRVLQGQQPLGAVAGAAVQVDLGFEALLQPGFGGEGPHQRQPGDRLPQQGGQFAHLLLALFGRPHHLGAEQAHQHRHQGRQQQGAQRQFPVEPHHVAEHHHQLQGRGGGVLNRFVDHLTDAVGVLGEPVGEVAGGEFLQHAEIQPLQPGKQAAAQLLAHPQRWPRQQGVLAELGHFLQHEHRQGQADHLQHAAEIPGADGRDQLPRQPGQQRPTGHKHEHAQPPRQQGRAVGVQQRQQATEAG